MRGPAWRSKIKPLKPSGQPIGTQRRMIFTGPATNVSTALNLTLSGDLFTDVLRASEGVDVLSKAYATVTVELSSQSYSGTVSNTTSHLSMGASSNQVLATGAISAYSGIGLIGFKTQVLTVPVGVPVHFRLFLADEASVDVNIGQDITAPISLWSEARGAHSLTV